MVVIAAPTVRITFVCTGNTCRSVMAEALCRHYAQLHSPSYQLEVTSAGVAAMEGEPPLEETRKVLRERGVDPGRIASRPVDQALVQDSELLVVMTKKHREALLRKFPQAKPKIKLLKEFSPPDPSTTACGGQDGWEVEDPFGGTLEEYRRTLEEIEEPVKALLENLEAHLPP